MRTPSQPRLHPRDRAGSGPATRPRRAVTDVRPQPPRPEFRGPEADGSARASRPVPASRTVRSLSAAVIEPTRGTMISQGRRPTGPLWDTDRPRNEQGPELYL